MTDKLDFSADGEGRFLIKGKMNYESCPAALDESMRLFRDMPNIELDLSAVDTTDSAGLALLVEWVGWAKREHRKLSFRHLPQQALALARISDVEKMLPVG
ncbi:MAG TPA: STAS domain-containing protein [Gammaproteobacteria bacterium]|nr:STAS domain-containing protein [Gammaproteobacteria bacterium]